MITYTDGYIGVSVQTTAEQLDTIKSLIKEYQFIMAVPTFAPGRSFNHDPKCFANYCDMQAKDFEKAGMIEQAKEVKNKAEFARTR